MEIKSSDDFYLFRRLDEIDGEQQDFHISAHKCDLLYKEQNSLHTISLLLYIRFFPVTLL